MSLDWDAASDNVGVTAYHVHRGTSAGFTPSAGNRVAVVSSGTAHVDTGLAAGEYFYRVTAVDAAGNVGPASSEVRATATADTQPPTVALSNTGRGGERFGHDRCARERLRQRLGGRGSVPARWAAAGCGGHQRPL